MFSLDQLEQVFHEALGVPGAEERLKWLEQRCGGDRELFSEVSSLLLHHDLEATAEQDPYAEGLDSAAERLDSAERPTRFGPYETIRVIGRGGMGLVYLARRADGEFEQTVALKLIAAPFATVDFIRRFRTERQLLAGLTHPNITRLLDGGVSAAGDPYLVMEYVAGETLDRHCDAAGLGIAARLRLFIQLCDAVEFAHRNLILHRDLKPSNVLVTADGVVKLLDFGTAALVPRAEATQMTGRMLTPRYASPARLRGERSSVADDVFSLGVVFYELLSGAWPYGDPSCVVSELRRAAAYSDPTPLDAAPTEDTASHRGLTRPALSRLLSGDLSAIAGKALENDPQRRYGTVEQFASDVRRYLDGRAVEARAQTAFYRSRKFVQRHWMPVLAAALFVIGLSTATAIAVQESRVARSHYEELRSLTASLLFELKDAINDVPGSTAAQKLLAARVVRTLDRMAAQTTSDPKLMLELAEAYRQFAELQASPFVQNLGDVAGARASLAKSQALVDPQIKAAPSDPAVLKTKALLERTIAEIGFVTGEEQSAVRHFLTADDIFDKLVAAPKPDISTLYEAAVTHQEAGDLFGQPGTPSLSDTQRAEKEYRRTIELDQVVLRRDPKALRALRGLGFMRSKIGDLYRFADPETALGQYRMALQAYDQLPPDEQSRPANLRFRMVYLRKIGGALRDLQQWSESERVIASYLPSLEKWAADDPLDSRAQDTLAVGLEPAFLLYQWQGNSAKSLPIARRMVSLLSELCRREPANQRWRFMKACDQYYLAVALDSSGNRVDALRVGSDALAGLRSLADAEKASAQTLIYASEAYARILPLTLRDGERAVEYARRYQQMRPPNDVQALYTRAIAQSVRGPASDAAEAARKALAALPPTKDGRVPYIRAQLEHIVAIKD